MDPLPGKTMPRRRKRRFFTYHTRTLLVLVAVAAVALVLYRAYVEPFRQQQAFLADIGAVGGSVKLERIGGGEQREWSEEGELGLRDRIVDVDLFNNGWRELEAVSEFEKELGADFEEILSLIRPAIPAPPDLERQHHAAAARCLQSLGRFSGMRRLSLRRSGDVQVNDAHLSALRALPELEHLDLTLTGITDVGLVHLRGLTQLKHLSLACCEITDEGLARIAQLPNLETLDLGSTDVTGAGLRALWGHPKLRRLALDRTQVVQLDLRNMPALETVYAFQTPLERLRLIGLGKLRTLDLSFTSIADDALHSLGRLPALERLDLSRTSVNGGGLQSLRGLPRLRLLMVDNQVGADVRLALQRAIPELEVRSQELTQ